MVFLDAPPGVADKAHAPGLEVRDAVPGVMDLPIRRAGEGVHGEVAARRVLPPIIGKGDIGMAAMGFDIDAQRRDLEMLAFGHCRDGAMLDTCRDVLDTGSIEECDDLLRAVRRRDVDIRVTAAVMAMAEQRVAHAAADEANLLAIG